MYGVRASFGVVFLRCGRMYTCVCICVEVRMRSGDVKPECMVFLSALGHYQGAMVYTRALARVWGEREKRENKGCSANFH